MNAAMAIEEQIRRYRRMTGEERLAIALELHDLACNLAREGIRRQHPDADPAGVDELLRKRIKLSREIKNEYERLVSSCVHLAGYAPRFDDLLEG